MAGIESLLEENRHYKLFEDFAKQANLQKNEYDELVVKAKDQPEKFYLDLLQKELDCFSDDDGVKPTLDKSKAPFYKWFGDKKINISYNCIDRHLKINGGNRDNKAALVWEGEPGDKQSFSYKELHTEVCKFANALKELSVEKGDIVTIYMPLCPQAIIAMHACNRIGAIHSVVFGGFSAEALKDRIVGGKSKLVITADGLFRKGSVVSLLDAAKKAVDGADCVENVIYYPRIEIFESEQDSHCEQDSQSEAIQSKTFINWLEITERQSDDCKPLALNGDDVSFILYTSGSTGKPKGIQHGTAGYLLWVHLTSKWVFDLKEEDVYWCTADVGWITGHSYLAYGPLSNGATCFLYEGAPNYPEENRFWQMIEEYKISIFYTAPTAIRAFIQWGEEHINKHDLSSLRLLGSVGEPINPDVWVWYFENIGKSKCPIVDTWWQTETGGIMITSLPGVHDMKPGAAGFALPGVDATINDDGFLLIKSPWTSMLQTVYGDDQRYLDCYWLDGAYLAGDGAHKDADGYIEIMGRIDDVINVSGHRLGTAEIESALISHPDLSEAAVVSTPHKIKGEGIVAYIVLKTSHGQNSHCEASQKYSKHLVEQIGAIARPEKIFVCKALPKTRSGKIMRRLLKELAQGKKPSGDMSTIENSSVIDELMKL